VISDQFKKLISKDFRVGSLEKAARVLASFSLTERLIFLALAIVFASSALTLLVKLNNELTVLVPSNGGSLTEGIIGIPRFINPLLAISDADRDLTTLVYSGLLKVSSTGILIGDLAESYSVSDNGLEYTFVLRENAVFHDGAPVTADDIVFTIKKAQDPNLKSPRRASWEGVTAEKVDNVTVKIKLKNPYPPFLENTTMGILPEHIWKGVDVEQFAFSQYNIEPVGSGPYRVGGIKRSSGGIPSAYTLTPFSKYTLGEAHISKVVLKFYLSEDALVDAYQQGDIESVNSISPHKALALTALGARVESASLPRIFAVFFNQNQAKVFTYKEVRQALYRTVDQERIVTEVLSGYGVPIAGPLPASLFETSPQTTSSTENTLEKRVTEAQALLKKNGWTPNPTDGVLEKKVKKETIRLEFSIATSNSEELKAAAKIIKGDWEKIGAKVSLNFFDTGDLNQNVIRPRTYDSLFFGEVIGRDLDLFAFWHSSQRNDPGLNVSLYANIKADKLLESARTTVLQDMRIEKYRAFAVEVATDMPAAFIYSPDFIYVIPKKIHGMSINAVTIPSDRFLNINEWHIETDRVWKLFAPKTIEDNTLIK